MNIKKLIEDFDTVVDETCNNLKDKVLADFKIPDNQITFKLSDDLQHKKCLLDKIENELGIYYFEINLKDFYKDIVEIKGLNRQCIKTRETLLGELNKIWTDKTVRNETKYPKIIIKRFNKHYRLKPYVNKFESDEWIPLYVGISKNLNARLNEHLHCESVSTFSMKLSHLDKYDFPIRISTSLLPGMDLFRRYMLVKEVEGIIRNECFPIIGKQ
ncbi:hypothetical protein ACWGKR_30755 [Bacillus thuringiensis]|uniref:GIY-YIG domain-containing protein n=1 Tax=Bacillus cereus (strain G9842) TaxID=405531 RepID=B7IZ22_BACC2|nr:MULTISPECIES: hypothetical protein [Bacillus cereus group]ACK98587.1 hypothetical protein BCG9842_0251 [Bacillus cereus G9842]MDR4137554.1 hypothetical protein [Bacillus cereus]MDR4367744.1 hypothetical protein [Bacillus cereus]PEE63429.1 hypothetical protein COM74_20210 [Bacillus thuringiensis]